MLKLTNNKIDIDLLMKLSSYMTPEDNTSGSLGT